MKYEPPYKMSSSIVNLVAEISEAIGRYTILAEQRMTPRLRRENRIRTIQASLAIENNTLTLEQVTAVIEGKRVLGHPREIQEVLNAFAAYCSILRRFVGGSSCRPKVCTSIPIPGWTRAIQR